MEKAAIAPIIDPPRSDLIQTVTGTSFKSLVVEGKGPIVVEFMTYGCSHCQTIEPILRQVAGRVGAKETFFRVNVAVEQELAETFQIQGTPTLIMFLDGTQVGRVEGPDPSVSSVLGVLSESFGS